MPTLSKTERLKYIRQIAMDEIQIAGQGKLKKAKVVIVGAGGLGSVVSTYLAEAGIGTLNIIDGDAIEMSNLNRQFLHKEADVGKKKATSASKTLKAMNSNVKIVAINENINKDNAIKLVQGADVIVDCLDNLSTRLILNDVSVKLNIPFFHGACYGFEGRVTIVIPKITPCLKCFFPSYSLPGKIPILGVTSGVIGAIQATEIIKYLVGIKPLLLNKLLIYDGKNLRYDLIAIQRNTNCPTCGNSRKQ